MRAYGVYTRVVAYQKSNKWAKRTSEISDTKQRVCKHRTKHFPWGIMFVIYILRLNTGSLNYDKLYLNKCGQTTITERKQLRKKRKSSNKIQNLWNKVGCLVGVWLLNSNSFPPPFCFSDTTFALNSRRSSKSVNWNGNVASTYRCPFKNVHWRLTRACYVVGTS